MPKEKKLSARNSVVSSSRGVANFPFGKIVGFHGLQGEVKVRPSSNKPELLEEVENVQTKETQYHPATDFTIISSHFDKKMYYLIFEGYQDRTSVEHLMGAELFTWEEELTELDEEEFWVKDLVGMSVVNQHNEHVGKVIDIVYGGNDLLEIQKPNDPPGKTVLIPFVKEIVPLVDKANKTITIAEIPGLLDAQ